jgi:hypothetical protein
MVSRSMIWTRLRTLIPSLYAHVTVIPSVTHSRSTVMSRLDAVTPGDMREKT